MIIESKEIKHYNNEEIKDKKGKTMICQSGAPCRYGFEVIITYKIVTPEGITVATKAKAIEHIDTKINGKPVPTPEKPPADILNKTFQDRIGIYLEKPIPAGGLLEYNQTLSVPFSTTDFNGQTLNEVDSVRQNTITIDITKRTIVIKDVTDYQKQQ